MGGFDTVVILLTYQDIAEIYRGTTWIFLSIVCGTKGWYKILVESTGALRVIRPQAPTVYRAG